MIGRDGGWTAVADIVDRNIYEDDGMTLKRMEWVVTGSDGQRYAFTARRLYAWTFPFDTYVLTEHMMEYTLEDGTKGYGLGECGFRFPWAGNGERSEEHTSELQSLMRISYAVFCLKKK